MPTLAAFTQERIASDYGLALLVLLALALAAALVWLQRLRAFIAVPYCDFSKVFGWIGRLRLAAVLTIALALRLPLMFQSLWYDESFSLALARLPLKQVPAAIAGDVHPPLYYLLKWLWAHLTGVNAWIFRLPDLALGLLAIYLLYRLARLVAGDRVGLTAALLMAVTPAAIYYSTEARMYALLTVLVFGALVFLLEDRYSLFALLCALLPATHNLGWFYAVVLVAAALWRWQPALWLASFSVYLPLALPNVALAAEQSHQMSDGYWLIFTPATPLWSLTFNLQTIDTSLIWPLVFPALVLTFLSLWTARALLHGRAGRAVALVILAVPVLAAAISAVWQPVYLQRALLPVSLLLLLPLAYALHSASAGRYRLAVGALGLLALLSFYRDAEIVRPDYRRLLKACGDARTVYATSIHTAFIASANTNREIIVWPGAMDGGQTLAVEQMPLYGFRVAAPPYSTPICLLLDESPRTSASERAAIGALLKASPFDFEYVEQRHRLRRISVFVVTA